MAGLIIPGGESTTTARLLLSSGLFEPLRALGERHFPIWGTCAGAILLADDARGLDRPALGLLPMTVERNAFGRQIDSFEADLPAPALGPAPYHAVVIRATRIPSWGEGVDVLMELHGEPFAVRYGALLATTFHQEHTAHRLLHAYFVQDCVAPARPTANPRRSPSRNRRPRNP